MIGVMRIACWMIKATDTHLECIILNAFARQNGYVNAPQCYVYTYIVPSCIMLRHEVIVINEKFNIFLASVCDGSSTIAIERQI
jgi:hypothetical protein